MRRRKRSSALVVGLGRFGRAAGETLQHLGWEVVGVDRSPEVVREMQNRLEHLIELDASNEEALASLSVPDFDVCIVSRGTSIESSILLVLNLQHLGAQVIVAKAASEHHAGILRRLQVHQIVFPERDAGIRLAENLHSPHITEHLPICENRQLAILRVPDEVVGAPLRRWKALSRSTIRVLARLNQNGAPQSLDPDEKLSAEDAVVVVGAPEELRAMRR